MKFYKVELETRGSVYLASTTSEAAEVNFLEYHKSDNVLHTFFVLVFILLLVLSAIVFRHM